MGVVNNAGDVPGTPNNKTAGFPKQPSFMKGFFIAIATHPWPSLVEPGLPGKYGTRFWPEKDGMVFWG